MDAGVDLTSEKMDEAKAHVVKQHRADFIQKVVTVMPIVDSLGIMVHPELYTGIQAEKTRQDQMRNLYTTVLDPGGTRVKAAFYDALKQHQPHMLDSCDVSNVPDTPGSSAASSQRPDDDLLVKTQGSEQQRISFYQKKFKTNVEDPFACVPEGTVQVSDKQEFVENYTYVSVIQVESTEVSSEHEVTQMGMKNTGQEIKLSEIFKSPSGQNIHRTVMSIGIAGVGKTFLVHKFISDWATTEMQHPHLIFVLHFRRLNLLHGKRFSLAQLIHKCIGAATCIPEEALNYIFTTLQESGISSYDKSPFKLLFILEGLDESRLTLDFNTDHDCSGPTSLEVLLVNLMKGELLRCAHIWVTTRPAAAKQIPSCFVNIVTEVKGFSDDKKKEYIMKRFSDENQAKRIISHITASKSIHIMCEVPVICSITATVLQHILKTDETGELPKTPTEMYCHFLLVQARRDGKKYETEADRTVLLKLARLAFEHLETGNLIFYQTDLEKCGLGVKEAPQYSALCTEIFKKDSDCFKDEPVYCFVHLSIQEFLAAVYLFHCFRERKMNVLHTFLADWKISLKLRKVRSMDDFLKYTMRKALKSENGHLDLFVRFLHGLSLESNQGLLKGLLGQTENSPESVQKVIQNLKEMNTDASPDRCINIFHCLMELKDQSVYQDIQTYMKSETKRGGELSEIQCSALAYMLQMSEEVLDELKLSTFNTSLEGRRRLIPALRNYIKAELERCGLTERCCDDLASVLSSNSSSLTILNLLRNELLHDAGVKRLCVGLKSPHCKLEQLGLGKCGLTERCCDDLASVLSSNSSSLTILDLWGNKLLHDAGAKRLCVGLKSPHCKLEKLKLMKCGLTERCCDDLASVLSSNSSSLTILDLSDNKLLHDAGVKRLCVGLKSPYCKRVDLSLERCGLTEICCDDLASVLSSNSSSLTILILSVNELYDAGAKRLCVGLKSPHCKLKELRLIGCGLTERCCEDLASVISSNSSSLTSLNMSRNWLRDAGAKRLCVGLKGPHCKLVDLGLEHNKLTEECRKELSVLSSNSSCKISTYEY